MSLEHKLDGLLAKHDELQNLLATQSGMSGQEYARLSKEFTELNEIVRVVKIYREVESEIRNLNLLLDEDISDIEVKALAEEELRELKQQLPSLKRDVQLQLLPKDSVDKKNAILEIRAGTGGLEATLFVADLYKMYEKVCLNKKWIFEIINILNKNNANIDEWQTEMEIKSLNKGNIYLFSEGLSNSEKRLTGVNIINNIEDAINKSITRHNNSNIAIIPEGPYVIPTL